MEDGCVIGAAEVSAGNTPVADGLSNTGDELAIMLRAFVDLASLDGVVLCSSVPQLVHEYEAFAERWAGADLLVLGPGVSTGVPIRYDDIVVAEIDIDSDLPAAFGDEDRVFLERVAELISPHCLVGWDTGGDAWEP